MPSIGDALFSSRAGIQSNGTAISVLADNIANSNTTAYKPSRPDFRDLLAGSIGGGGSGGAGSGSEISTITPIFNQGTLEVTGRSLDVGIDGGGFFAISDGSTRFYTRAGNFAVDTDGTLRTAEGFSVLGFPAAGNGGVQALNVNQRSSADVSTTAISMTGNLDASSAQIAGAAAIPLLPGSDFSDLDAAAAYSSFVDVFDSLGVKHTLTTYFFHTGTNEFTARGYMDASEVDLGGGPGAVGNPAQVYSVTMTFGADGQLTVPANAIGTFAAGISYTSGASNPNVSVDLSGFTQFASPSLISSLSQNGVGGGSVISFSIEEDGTLFAQLDNGQTSTIGTLALVNFSNVEGLRRVGKGNYVETTTSGEPVIGNPGTGQFGKLQSGALESSTADIAGDFIKLITIQRGFQASSRVVSNIDDLLNEIINLA